MSFPNLAIDDQGKILDDALSNVKVQTFQMKRCLENDRLMDALKHCSTMLNELRTSALTPKNYYELYMSIFDSLRYLSHYLVDSHNSKKQHLADLYELVQYAGNIIPRLYLMITVGSAYMSTKETPVKIVMRDMMEMSRGIQHPIRGLFLRHYLSSVTKDYLPDGVDPENANGDVSDSINFILQNFTEMNKLWVRLQHQGLTRDREKREAERKELRILVGTNLVRLSQLEAVDLEMYQKTILPAILEQAVICKDTIAQEYLMEVIIQVFPDSFHLRTLGPFLSATAQLTRHVNVKQIVISLIDRLSAYALRIAEYGSGEDLDDSKIVTEALDTKSSDAPGGKRGIPDDVKLFEVFWKQVTELIKARPDLTLQDITSLLVSLTNLSLSCYPEELHYIDQILGFAGETILSLQQSGNVADMTNNITLTNLQGILTLPLKTYTTILTLLKFPSSARSAQAAQTTITSSNYTSVLNQLPYSARHHVSIQILNHTLSHQTVISTPDSVSGIFDLISTITKDQKDGPTWKHFTSTARRTAGGSNLFGGIDSEDMESDADKAKRREHEVEMAEEQALIAKLVHLLVNEDPDTHFLLLSTARKYLSEGGPYRIKFTFPALVYSTVKLAHRYNAFTNSETSEESSTRTKIITLFKFIHQIVTVLNAKCESASEICLRLFLLSAQSADECGFEEIAYEFYVQAFTIYEESVSDSYSQFTAITLIIGSLQSSTVFSFDNYDTLITKCTLHASKLLKRPDQCRGVTLCSHLFWQNHQEHDAIEEKGEKAPYRDSKRVLECLQKALKIADSCLDPVVNLQLFVEILNRCLWFFAKKCDAVTTKYLNGLIDLISTNLSNLHESSPDLSLPTTSHGSSLSLFGSQERTNEEYLKNIIKSFVVILQTIETRKQNSSSVSYMEIDTSALSKL
ncbi:vacuolar protein sorting-associated protein 35 [Paraphysoderma sedebokerense]|nr:vacuolar protein sorting-associated protein 35 [Paraphysoderma sedebokerense]